MSGAEITCPVTTTAMSSQAARQAAFTLSATTGAKTVYAQFRGPSGNTPVVQLPQPITQNPPQLAVSITSLAAEKT